MSVGTKRRRVKTYEQLYSSTKIEKLRKHGRNNIITYRAGPDARVGDVVVVDGKGVPILDNDGLREIVARWKND